jgi:hypothetical protein
MGKKFDILDKVIWALFGICLYTFGDFVFTITTNYMEFNRTIDLQKQTIYRLNNQLSKMDTLHDECFKVSEIRNAKNK